MGGGRDEIPRRLEQEIRPESLYCSGSDQEADLKKNFGVKTKHVEGTESRKGSYD